MYIRATLSPALGCRTVVMAGGLVRFVATLNVPADSRYADEDYQIELWHTSADGLWKASAFCRIDESELKVHNLAQAEGTKAHSYVLYLAVVEKQLFEFTLRYRADPTGPWIWSKDQTNQMDGQIIVAVPGAANINFDTIFSEVDSALIVKSQVSQVTGIDVFSLSASAPVLCNEFSLISLGFPLSLQKFYALVKISTPWMASRQGTCKFVVDRDALIVGYLRADGRHVVVLGISTIDCSTYLRSDSGKVLLKSRNDTNTVQKHRVILATGYDWQRTVDAAFYAARDISTIIKRKTFSPQAIALDITSAANQSLTWQETWYDGLGYCTWNSLGSGLTQDRVLSALQEIHNSGVNISTLIIDDNWQSNDSGARWIRFEANLNFPQGLAYLTSEIRRRFPNIKHIAVWHTILGYWEGIAPGGWIDKNYKCRQVKWRGGRDVLVVDASDVNRFYNDFYRFLSDSGVDAVKCDYQAALEEFDNAEDRKALAHAYHDAFKTNSLQYFDGRVIYCMSMQPIVFFHSLMQPMGPKPLLRNSDDFFPNIPSSHLWHVFTNAMNNIFTSHLHSLPDWDMFQSTLPKYASLHAAGRCISGGPVYITDSPGKHDLSIIRQMTALSIQSPSRHVILRPSRVSLPVDPYVAYNQAEFLKTANYFGGYRGSSLLSIFNVSETLESLGTVSLNDFQGIIEDMRYVVRSHTSGKVYEGSARDDLLVLLSLPVAGWEFMTAVAVKEISHYKGSLEVAIFGLISSLSGVAAVESWTAHREISRIMLSINLKALGVLGIYVSDLSSRSIGELFVTIGERPVPVNTVKKSSQDARILEIDVENAWKELRISSAVSHDAVVKLYLE